MLTEKLIDKLYSYSGTCLYNRLDQHQPFKRKTFLWHKADMASIKKIINQFNNSLSERFSLSTPVDILWKEYKSMCHECLDHVPTRSNTIGMKQSWITPHIKRLSHKKTMSIQSSKTFEFSSSLRYVPINLQKKEIQKECCKAYHNYMGSYSTRTVP